jgi:hypothetical protein
MQKLIHCTHEMETDTALHMGDRDRHCTTHGDRHCATHGRRRRSNSLYTGDGDTPIHSAQEPETLPYIACITGLLSQFYTRCTGVLV